MKRIQDEETKERVLAYLKEHLEECIYLTIDLERYGYDSPEVDFWYTEKNDIIDTVLMKYYDSFQIFSADENWDAHKTAEFINSFRVITICAKESMIQKLESLMPEYSVLYGIVVKEDQYREFKQFQNICLAQPDDVKEIAELLYTDEDFSNNYTLEGLEKQLQDRMEEGVGRNYIMREDGKIVAHTAVYAECENIAIEGGLIVREEYKKKLYGMILHEFMKKKLLEEGKAAYGFRVMNNMQRYAKLGNINIVGHYGKMSLIDKK